MTNSDRLEQEDDDYEECNCEYPHASDFEPPFELCTCKPSCWHITPLDIEKLLRREGKESDG